MSLREYKKEYLMFLENVPLFLKEIKELLNKDYINYSFEEIEQVKEWYLKYYKNPEEINLTYKELSNILYAYFGTAFVNYNGGNWELNDVKTDEAFGTPTIINWGGKEYPWISISPYIWRCRLEKGKLGSAKKIFNT